MRAFVSRTAPVRRRRQRTLRLLPRRHASPVRGALPTLCCLRVPRTPRRRRQSRGQALGPQRPPGGRPLPIRQPVGRRQRTLPRRLRWRRHWIQGGGCGSKGSPTAVVLRRAAADLWGRRCSYFGGEGTVCRGSAAGSIRQQLVHCSRAGEQCLRQLLQGPLREAGGADNLKRARLQACPGRI